MATADTIAIENRLTPPFFNKTPLSIERGQGVRVWDEEGREYLDFTSGWGVTCLGHAHPVIIEALTQQGHKIIQNPNSGLTYSPVRARLLSLLAQILPEPLTRIFFSNSGAEANDAAIKLARKVTGRMDVIATEQSFHGRTISTASATGQAKHREKFNPLMPNYQFVPFNDIAALKQSLTPQTAAVILEPIQGEGGIVLPETGYLNKIDRLCKANGSLVIVDEVQTGFFRTGQAFGINNTGLAPDIMTMAKGIAGGFPLGAFAVSETVSDGLEKGDHGGTYCGNPLGCAVALAVIHYLMDHHIGDHVLEMGALALGRMKSWPGKFPGRVKTVRGQGLLLVVEFVDESSAAAAIKGCFKNNLLVTATQKTMMRIFPALIITPEELTDGLDIIEAVLSQDSE
jgi:acetylornithine/N-succinyldiaminopimelate aminotransferase